MLSIETPNVVYGGVRSREVSVATLSVSLASRTEFNCVSTIADATRVYLGDIVSVTIIADASPSTRTAEFPRTAEAFVDENSYEYIAPT